MVNLRQIIAGIFAQLRRLWKVLLLLYAPLAILFIALDVASRASDDIPLSYFTRDITAIGDLPFFAGIVSQFGGLLWAASLAVCLFTLFVLNKQTRETGASRRLLAQAALLTTVLLFDDFFLLHEVIGPDYLHISEKVIVSSYGLIAVFFLFSNLNEILKSEYLILGLALGMFALSIFFDGAHLDKYEQYSFFFNEQFQTFLEDAFKFIGVATWLAYFGRYGYQKVAGPQASIPDEAG